MRCWAATEHVNASAARNSETFFISSFFGYNMKQHLRYHATFCVYVLPKRSVTRTSPSRTPSEGLIRNMWNEAMGLQYLRVVLFVTVA